AASRSVRTASVSKPFFFKEYFNPSMRLISSSSNNNLFKKIPPSAAGPYRREPAQVFAMSSSADKLTRFQCPVCSCQQWYCPCYYIRFRGFLPYRIVRQQKNEKRDSLSEKRQKTKEGNPLAAAHNRSGRNARGLLPFV